MSDNNNMSKVFESANQVVNSEAAKAAIKAAQVEIMSFNRVIKVMKGATVFAYLVDILRELGINSADELTVKNIRSLIHADLTKEVNVTVDTQEKTERQMCTIRRQYETVEAIMTDAQGRPLCKVVDGKAKPRTQKVVMLDEDGNKVVKGHTLCVIRNWTIQHVINILAQSKAIREAEGAK